MKNILKFGLLLFLSVGILSCKKEIKKEVDENINTYSLDTNSALIGWTAYKTTAKKPVKGVFKKVTVSTKPAKSEIDAINGSEFSIPVSSIFSNNKKRDSKLQKFFFDVMDNTSLLTGKIAIKDKSTGNLTILMNGVSKNLPFTFTLSEGLFTLTGTMNLDQWNGQSAIISLNKACLELHAGADGISKTWNDVQIDASISIVKN
ncbi:MAG: YceI family protein [Flavobacteriaceae bacterium]|nr:YceI family protein [Flavobacteriaceae bacterium]